jgi:hypothetical protein
MELQFAGCAQHNPIARVQLGLAEILRSRSCVAVASCVGVRPPECAFHNAVYVCVAAFIFLIGKTCAVRQVTPAMESFLLFFFSLSRLSLPVLILLCGQYVACAVLQFVESALHSSA